MPKATKATKATKKVTEDMVSNWVGNHGYSEKRDAWMLETLTELANGYYTTAQLNDEVTEYNK